MIHIYLFAKAGQTSGLNWMFFCERPVDVISLKTFTFFFLIKREMIGTSARQRLK